MQSVQRRFGKLLPRTADESQVAVLLKDFDDADKMFTRVGLKQNYQCTLNANNSCRSSTHPKLGVMLG